MRYAQNLNPTVNGKARFTIIDEGLIRMEYATDGKFTDEPTLFATNRTALSKDFSVTKKDKNYTIVTKNMEVKYVAENLPFSEMNIRLSFLIILATIIGVLEVMTIRT